jgi:hypothetical protein
MFIGRSFVVVPHTPVRPDIQTYRPNHEKIIGENIFIPAEVREELGLRL